jgi:hypothetical protein
MTPEQEQGLRLYPIPSLCSWCNQVHAGNAANCYTGEELDSGNQDSEPPIVEQVCDYVLSQVKEITNSIKEKVMIPKSTGAPVTRSSNGKTVASSADRGGLPYLNLKNMHDYFHVGVSTDVKIVDCRVKQPGENNFNDVTVKLNIGGRTILWGLSISTPQKQGNPNLPILEEMFGSDEKNWAGQTFLMTLAQDDFSEKIFPHVVVTPQESTSRKKGR